MCSSLINTCLFRAPDLIPPASTAVYFRHSCRAIQSLVVLFVNRQPVHRQGQSSPHTYDFLFILHIIFSYFILVLTCTVLLS